MTNTILRGLMAGAVGTTALNLATYLDMLGRGRPASEAPSELVEDLAHRAGTDIPGTGEVRQNRRSALGTISGMAVGAGVGVLASAVRSSGVRLPLPVAGVLAGAAAMAGSDLPIAATGISDPRSWDKAAWLADALPHLVFGLATCATVRALER